MKLILHLQGSAIYFTFQAIQFLKMSYNSCFGRFRYTVHVTFRTKVNCNINSSKKTIQIMPLFIKIKETDKKHRNNEDVKEEVENMRKEIDELNDDMNSLQRVLNFIKVISLSM